MHVHSGLNLAAREFALRNFFVSFYGWTIECDFSSRNIASELIALIVAYRDILMNVIFL